MQPLWPILFLAVLSAGPPSSNAKLDQLRVAAQERPNDAHAWLALAQELDQRGQEQAAIEAYQKAQLLPAAQEAMGRYTRLDDTQRAAKYFVNAAAGYESDNQPEAADRCWREVVRLSGDKQVMQVLLKRSTNSDTASQLPSLVGSCGKPREFVAALEKWAERYSNVNGPLIALAECSGDESLLLSWLRKHDDSAAYAALARMRTAKPEQLCEMFSDLNNLEAANADRAKAMMAGLQSEPEAIVAILKSHTAPRNSRWQIDCQQLVRLAVAGDCLELAETTLQTWRAANRRFGGAGFANQSLLEVYDLTGQYARAEELSRRCLAEEDQNPTMAFDYRWRRALILMHLDREEEALAIASKLAESKAIDIQLLYVDVLSWFGKHKVADAVARRLLEDNPDRKSEQIIRLRLATIAETRGDSDIAEGHLLRVLELAPKNTWAHNNLGYFWAEQNRRLADAERLCRFAVERGRPSRGPDDPGGDDVAYRDSLAWVYYRQGRFYAAQEEIEKTLQLPGGKIDAVIWEHYGDILAARGKIGPARAAWAKALARFEPKRTSRDDPHPAELRRKLAGN